MQQKIEFLRNDKLGKKEHKKIWQKHNQVLSEGIDKKEI